MSHDRSGAPELLILLGWRDENPVNHIVGLTEGSDGYTAQARQFTL